MKLQQAYFSESSKAGGWQLIGYMAPGKNSVTTNFSYHPGVIDVGSSAELDGTAKVGWKAGNFQNLNECTGGGANNPTYHWTIGLKSASATTNGNADVEFVASAANENGTGCVALTPTFDKIGK